MAWLQYVFCFFGGVFLTNAMPHWICGVMGRPFQSPFASPPGQGLSSSTVNVLWGFFNLAVGVCLLRQSGSVFLYTDGRLLALGAGIFVMSLVSARLFGRFNGGHAPGSS